MPYRRLAGTVVSATGCFVLDAFNPPSVTADSPAALAMTDLARVPPATITSEPSIETANQSMLLRGVRLLLVVGEANRIIGVVTADDLLGERPLLIARRRQAKRSDLRVADVMTPVDEMEALRIDDVRRASVGDIIATLKADGRTHALVVGDAADGTQRLMGIFSASQIARQLGVQIQTHEIARTFAEIEAVIAGV